MHLQLSLLRARLGTPTDHSESNALKSPHTKHTEKKAPKHSKRRCDCNNARGRGFGVARACARRVCRGLCSRQRRPFALLDQLWHWCAACFFLLFCFWLPMVLRRENSFCCVLLWFFFALLLFSLDLSLACRLSQRLPACCAACSSEKLASEARCGQRANPAAGARCERYCRPN